MLERLWVKQEEEKHFGCCLAFSLIFTLLSIFIAHYFVPFRVAGMKLTGLIAVMFASLAASYPLIKYLEDEEDVFEKDEKNLKDTFDLLERHSTELKVYLAFFLGVTLAFGISSVVLPAEVFEVQHEVIGSIRPDVAAGRVFSPGFFTEIITNNISVFFVTFLLSFFLTAGMVFILVWNASILGIFISEITKGIVDVPLVALSYLPHGILEIAAYIIAGLSGFFLSHEVGLVLEWEDKSRAIKLMRDSILFLVIGFIVLVIAAVIESTGV